MIIVKIQNQLSLILLSLIVLVACGSNTSNAAEPAHGGVLNSKKPCANYSGLEPLPWLPNKADTYACELTAVSHPATFVPRPSYLAAYQAGKLVAFKDPYVKYDTGSASIPQFATEGFWGESDHVGSEGYLWWGRSSTGYSLAIGRESYTWLKTSLAGYPNPLPAMPTTYLQHAATQPHFSGGLGGEGIIPLGKVKNASIKIFTTNPIHGILSFDLTADGQTRTFNVPLKRSLLESRGASKNPEELYRLKNGIEAGGEITDCISDLLPGCVFQTPGPRGEGSKEAYEAKGVFFGTASEFLAVSLNLVIDVVPRNRTGVSATTIIILKAKL